MRKLLDKRIDESEHGAVEMQLQIGGQPIAGAVKRSEECEGLYEILTFGVHDGQQSMFKVTFSGDAVEVMFERVETESESSLFVPKRNGIIVPGAA